MRSAVLWSLAALAGILVAAGITLAASSLWSQQIGLSSEPLSAGDDLVPATPTGTPTPRPAKTSKPEQRKRRAEQQPATPAPTLTSVPTVQAESGDDHGGSRGSGSDDGGGSSGKG